MKIGNRALKGTAHFVIAAAAFSAIYFLHVPFPLVVLAAGIATAWWGAQAVGMDLSGIKSVAAVLGLNETIGATHRVGYSQVMVDQQAAAQAYPEGQDPASSRHP